VNNFAAATGAVTDSGWPMTVIFCIQSVFPPRRARSANDKSL
jgi:hypothetical protein